MNFVVFLVLAATLAVVVSLTSGVLSMAQHGDVGHRDSAHWMVWRVVFQAIAFLTVLVSLYAFT